MCYLLSHGTRGVHAWWKVFNILGGVQLVHVAKRNLTHKQHHTVAGSHCGDHAGGRIREVQPFAERVLATIALRRGKPDALPDTKAAAADTRTLCK